MDQSQIRAIGTHDNESNTARWIKWEFNWLVRTQVFQQVRDWIESVGAPPGPVNTLHEYLDEAHRKAGLNRKAYESARNTLNTVLTAGPTRDATLDLHAPAASIWDTPGAKALSAEATRGFLLAKQLRLLTLCLAEPSRSKRHETRLKTNADEASLSFEMDLPTSPSEARGATGIATLKKEIDRLETISRAMSSNA